MSESKSNANHFDAPCLHKKAKRPDEPTRTMGDELDRALEPFWVEPCDRQRAEALPTEEHDRQLSAVVTPTRLYGPFA